jgi:glycosyltransferase involved in cell wall biosynthesis
VALYAGFERIALGRADEMWAVSDEDAAVFGATRTADAGPRARVRVVPNVVLPRPVPPRSPDPGTALFVGSLWYEPNQLAAGHLVEVADRLRHQAVAVQWTIVGGQPPAELVAAADRLPNVAVVGYVDDLGERLARAAVAVFPVTIGGGSMLKLLDALRSGCPVLTTPEGARGVAGLRDGEHVVVRPLGPAFDAAAAAMALDPVAHAAMAERGRRLVEARYSLDALCSIVGRAVADLVGVAPG